MLKLIFKNLKAREFALIFIGAVFIVSSIWLELKVPSFMSQITQVLVTRGKTSTIVEYGVLMLVCALGCSVCSVVSSFCIAYMGANVAKRLRFSMYSKVQDLSLNDFSLFPIPSLITRTTNDVMHIQNFLSRGLQVCVKAPIMAVWAILIIMGKSWQWTVATAVAVFCLIVMLLFILMFAVPKFKKIQKQTDALNQVARENLAGVRVVRAFNAEKFQESKFDNANKNLTKTNLFVNRVVGLIGPAITLISNALSITVYMIGAVIIASAVGADKLILFSDMMVFTSYAMQVIMSFMMISVIFIMLPRASVSANRVLEVLNTKPKIVDGNFDVVDLKQKGTIEFKNVSFKYPGAEDYLLKDISFVASQGENIAIIGPTGCGKSTLVNLICRFYDVTEGEILVDGVNIKKFKLKDLYNRVGYVSQKAFLFSETVENNINFGESLMEETEANVLEALKIAEADEFVLKMKDGIESQIEQAGHNISGGQKQRLSIARAIARKPEFIILDDCFSALDFKTDKNLRENIAGWSQGITTFMVAQRIGTIAEADQIIVLDKGRIVGHGTHDELLKNCELYKEIAESQFSKEEQDGRE